MFFWVIHAKVGNMGRLTLPGQGCLPRENRLSHFGNLFKLNDFIRALCENVVGDITEVHDIWWHFGFELCHACKCHNGLEVFHRNPKTF